VYKHPAGIAYIMVYVDDLLFVGEPSEANHTFAEIQKHPILRKTGIAEPGKATSFLGRKITNSGSHFDIILGDSYVQNILYEAELSKCNPAPTLGTSATKSTIEDEELLIDIKGELTEVFSNKRRASQTLWDYHIQFQVDLALASDMCQS